MIGGQPVERSATPHEAFQPPLATSAQKQSRPTELLLAAVGPEAPSTLTATAPAAKVKAGPKLELAVQVKRKARCRESEAVTVLGLPAHVTAAALTLNGDKTEGKITLAANGNAAQGPGMRVIQGNAKNVRVATPALPLTVSRQNERNLLSNHLTEAGREKLGHFRVGEPGA